MTTTRDTIASEALTPQTVVSSDETPLRTTACLQLATLCSLPSPVSPMADAFVRALQAGIIAAKSTCETADSRDVCTRMVLSLVVNARAHAARGAHLFLPPSVPEAQESVVLDILYHWLSWRKETIASS